MPAATVAVPPTAVAIVLYRFDVPGGSPMPTHAPLTIHPPAAPPPELLLGLQRARLRYSTPVDFYHCVHVSLDIYCGVFGDGDNGAYEWFVWREDGTLETSDVAYGCPEIALRDVLNKVVV